MTPTIETTVTSSALTDAGKDQNSEERALSTDAIASIVLIFVAVLTNLVASVIGFTLIMMSSSCNDSCSAAFFSGGVLFAFVAPSIVTIAGVFITIVRVIRRQTSFWIPLVAIGAQGLTLAIGALVVYHGLGAI